MNQRSPTFRVRARGPYACFTRPELKAERVSYEVMTPSAARGLLEAVLWKPAIQWRPERIRILAPIRFDAIRRNEVGKKASLGPSLFAYCADEDRQQRNSIVLKDVDYLIEAHFLMTKRAGPEDNIQKFTEMFHRRLAKGQCFQTPYFGCREFAARVQLAPEGTDLPEPIRESRPLGLMLHDLKFNPTGQGTPFFFEAVLSEGCMEIPEVPQ